MRAQRHPARPPRRQLSLRAPLHGAIALSLFVVVLVGGAFPLRVPDATGSPSLQAAAFSLPGLAASAPLAAVTALEAAPVSLAVVSRGATAEQALRVADSASAAVAALQQSLGNRSTGTSGVTAREPEPKYYRYEVQRGDTLAAISTRFGISRQYIEWNNVDVIEDANLLSIGMMLQIPSTSGIIHGVRSGETLTEIAEKYDASVRDIIDFPANALSDPNQLREGSLILVVNGKRLPAPAPTLRPLAPAAGFVDRAPSGFGFSWPVLGPITSYFGYSHPFGIDISAPYLPVAAAQAGRVIFVGGDACCSYGRYIEIDHGSGYETLYAHLSNFNVVKDQLVARGQIIAVSGNSGNSTGPHLHFELHRNGVIQNPLEFLP
ncbi:MAG: LysM peptidoglycan-binding domain-containing protein [Dehalococcoidia bacterium]|nr:LysM peptidoglycan-binding domain-containing protein [Dehalococcoidia bacterium]